MFRVWGFCGAIWCGFEGSGGVGGSIIVDVFDLL